jgi:hypothetical protein
MSQKAKNAIWGAIALIGGMILYDIVAYFF